MVYIKQDTIRLKECSKQINDAVSKCNDEVNSFFSKINKLSDYWIGEDADSFLSAMKNEKKIYLDFNNQISSYSDSILELSTELEKAINACKLK